MGKLIRKILENVAGAVGAIAFSDWNDQTIIKAKSEGSTASIRSGGTSALAVPAAWATQQVFVYIFTGNGDISSTSQYVGSVTV